MTIILVMLLFSACSSVQEVTETAPVAPEIRSGYVAPKITEKAVGANKRFQAPPFRRSFTKPVNGTPFQRY